ncbi:MAG: GNAT family N-acetyltransferase [Lachnospiraceae bacterium]|nr:GNAT family N-acetyltransferase [Lachnospiraceae bacterium]
MILHLANTTELLGRARRVREQVFTIEKQIPKSIEVDQLDCLNDSCDHFVIEVLAQDECSAKYRNTDGKEICSLGGDLTRSTDVCALRCKKLDDKRIQLQRFCVLKDYRETGVGRWALEQVEKYYWKQGVEEITLDAKFHVSGFYEKCGYVVASELFMEAGVEHVAMEKRRKWG